MEVETKDEEGGLREMGGGRVSGAISIIDSLCKCNVNPVSFIAYMNAMANPIYFHLSPAPLFYFPSIFLILP